MHPHRLPVWLQHLVETMGGGGLFLVGFLGAIVSVCYRRLGDSAFICTSEAYAVLRGNGCDRFDRGMHLAILAGEKRWRGIFSSARGGQSGKNQELGDAKRVFEHFYSCHTSAAAAIQGIRSCRGSVSGSVTHICVRSFAGPWAA